MKNVFAWQYQTRVGLMDALAALERSHADLQWRIHESTHLGRYLQGTDEAGIEIKVMLDDGELEIWFPTTGDFSDEDKGTFIAQAPRDILPALRIDTLTPC